METNTLKDFPRTAAVLKRYAELFIERYRLAMADNKHAASGALANSLKYRIRLDGNDFAVDIHLKDYWQYIENGTRPHWPPRAAILKWIQVKPVIPEPMKDGRLPSPEQLAFLISRKIAREGTVGTHDLALTNNQLFQEMGESIGAALMEDLERHVTAIFTAFKPIGNPDIA